MKEHYNDKKVFNSIIENNESAINMSELDKQKIIEKLRQSIEVSSELFTSGQVAILCIH